MLKFNENFYADVRIEDRFGTAIMCRNGKIEELKETNRKKAFIRVFDGEMWYYLSTGKLDDLQGELDSLYKMATPNQAIADNPIVKSFEVNKANVHRFADCNVKNVSVKDKQAVLMNYLDELNASKYMKMSYLIYSDRHSEYEFYSSKGAEISYDFQLAGSLISLAVANEKDNFTNSCQSGGTKFDESAIISKERVAEFIKETDNFLEKAKPVIAGDYPVVISPMVAGVFAHESFGHKSESDFMVGNEQMKKDWTLGKAVGSPLLSIYDSGLEEGSGYVPFDDEGTKATKTYLIKDGILTGRLHSASTACILGEGLTGNARAMSTDYEPIVRMTTTVIDKGDSTLNELIKGVKHGFFIKTLKHGSGMSTFTIAPLLSYEIVDGKIGDPVKIAVMTGNVFETLGLIDGTSDTVEIMAFIGGGCGKMEQYPLNVGFGGPYVRISKISIQ